MILATRLSGMSYDFSTTKCQYLMVSPSLVAEISQNALPLKWEILSYECLDYQRVIPLVLAPTIYFVTAVHFP